ncbi:hypothetical protein ACFE04_022628 [Oxalis oulophora]
MPTFSAIALDRLLEPSASSAADMTVPTTKPIPKPKPPTNPKLERRHSSTTVAERKLLRPQISSPSLYTTPESPSLYTTPKSTPLPDSPSSFPPSPYIVNHKRRGSRLLKSFSEANVSSRENAQDKETKNVDEEEPVTNNHDSKKKGPATFTFPEPIDENGKHANGSGEEGHFNSDGEAESSTNINGSKSLMYGLLKQQNVPKHVKLNVVEGESESEDFYDPQESMSLASNTDTEDKSVFENSASARFATPMGEYYDAWDVSSDSGRQTSAFDSETELREVRMCWLMELERRKQAEEVLEDMRDRWGRIRQQLSTVGLTLPVDPTESLGSDPGEDLCRQIYVTRIVSEAIGKGLGKAEMEMEMEAQIESKNFEISRLSDRLKYYEAVNREMSQRNQEAVEMARRDRHRKERRRKWIWGSVVIAVTLGTTALAWSYLPTSKGSSATDDSGAPERK